MAETFRAAVVHELGEPLVVEEIDLPVPGPNEALVKVTTRASATPTCTPPTATGRSSRARRSSLVTRESARSWRSATR